MEGSIKYLNPYTLLLTNFHGSIRELCGSFSIIFIHPIGGIQSQSSVIELFVLLYERLHFPGCCAEILRKNLSITMGSINLYGANILCSFNAS